MKKLLTILACFMLAFTSLAFAGCKKGDYYEPTRNVVQNLPEKFHVEYNQNDYFDGYIFVKDGNEYYINGKNHNHTDRHEIYMKTNLTREVCVAEGYGGWLTITAHWNGSAWILASNETDYTPNEGAWHANDHNLYTHQETEVITRTGYTDINPAYENSKRTITHLANQTVTLRSGQQVECEVWDYEWEDGDTYSHYRYWYAVDTGVYIKEMHTFNKNVNVETEGTAGDYFATYYKIGDSMDTILAAKGKTKPDMSAFN